MKTIATTIYRLDMPYYDLECGDDIDMREAIQVPVALLERYQKAMEEFLAVRDEIEVLYGAPPFDMI